MNKNLVITFLIGVVVGGAGLYLYQSQNQAGLSPEKAGAKAISFINQAIQEQGVTASLLDIVEESGIYKIHIKIDGNEYDSYITKDGKFLFSSAPFNLDEQSAPEETTQETTKSDIPDVKLFVMSYCPYGLQAQKMFLPVYNLLKDKAKIGVYFVNYIMHEKQEIDENLRQYCIEKVETEKYDEYLSCFVKEGNFEACLSEALINMGALQSCISATDEEYKITAQYNDKNTWLQGRFPKFDVNTDLNEKYGVGGSPTLVINDQIVNLSSRSPEKFKEAVCNAFSSPPQECSQTLSDQAFTPGFGLEEGATSGGSCQ